MSEIYKGIIVDIESSSIVKVYIPSLSPVQLGRFEYPGSNVGSNFDMTMARSVAKRCRLMTPLSSGAWWTYVEEEDAVVPGVVDKIKDTDIMDFTMIPNATSLKHSVHGSLQSPSNTPAMTLSAVCPSLGQAGGIPIPSTSNVPPGYFPKPKVCQQVLVAFVNNSLPIVIGTLPTDYEFEATIG